MHIIIKQNGHLAREIWWPKLRPATVQRSDFDAKIHADGGGKRPVTIGEASQHSHEHGLAFKTRNELTDRSNHLTPLLAGDDRIHRPWERPTGRETPPRCSEKAKRVRGRSEDGEGVVLHLCGGTDVPLDMVC